MRKTLVISGAGLLFSLNWPAAAQHLTPQEKVDSTFRVNFRSLDKKINKHQHLISSEIEFVYVTSFMSGIDFNLQSYSGTPLLTQQKLQEFKGWHQQYKSKIEWRNYQQGIKWLRWPLYLSPYDKSLDSLNTKFASLKID